MAAQEPSDARLVQPLEDVDRRILRSITEFAVIGLDRDGFITSWNTGAERLLGYAPEEVVGRSAALLWTTEDLLQDKPRRELQAATVTGRGEDDNWLVRKDRSVFWASGLAMPMHDDAGEVVGFVKVVRDLTKHKRNADELQTANLRLQEFVNMAAHELSTPLTPIRLQVDLLKASSDARTERQLAILDRNIDRLSLLLRDILDAARLRSPQLRLEVEDVPLEPLVHQALEAFQEQAEAGGVALRLGNVPPAAVRVDPRRTTQVLFNLLSNALKFTPEGGRIEVDCQVPPGEDHVVVSVLDSGTGIRPEDLKTLFQPFRQVGRVQDRQVGTGLGLFICRGLVERLGGKLWAESDGPGRGAAFRFTLPLAPLDAEQASSRAPGAAEVAPREP